MIWATLLSTVLAKFGIWQADKKDWFPKNHYQKKAVDCLKQNDIPGAIENNLVTLKKDPSLKEAQIVRELILMSLESHIKENDKKIGLGKIEIDDINSMLRKSRIKLTFSVFLNTIIVFFIAFLPYLTLVFTDFLIPDLLYLIYYSVILIMLFLHFRFYLFHPQRSPSVKYYAKKSKLDKKLVYYRKKIKELKAGNRDYNKLVKFVSTDSLDKKVISLKMNSDIDINKN
ncbi:hypothetical protein ACFL7D_10005 [candidate division KSB1 bacterium]